MQPGKRAVLFDLYGTLIYEEPGLDTDTPDSVYTQLAVSAGVSFTDYRAARNPSSHLAMIGQLKMSRALPMFCDGSASLPTTPQPCKPKLSRCTT